jgi:hypothetical protein
MLPSVTQPYFDTIIPSSERAVKYRPFLVKEEKILLFALEDGTHKAILDAIKRIVENCVFYEDGKPVNANNLTTFDIEYLYIKLRSKSVDNMLQLEYLDHEDQKSYKVSVNLDEIEVKKDPAHSKKIRINEELGVVMKYPTAATMALIVAGDDTATITTKLLGSCIEMIYDKETVYPIVDATPDEIEVFIDSLPVKAFQAIQDFFATMPTISHEIKYTNSMGTERVIKLSSLADFFTFA